MTASDRIHRRAPSTLQALLCLALLPAAVASAQMYSWKPVVIKGGGFVTGIVTHPNAPGVVYCRTDIGGAYRWNAANGSWIPLLDFATGVGTFGVESLALDPADSDRLYLAVGRGSASLLISTDRGATFATTTPPFTLDGNAEGRSNGERMAVDPNSSNILFYGTRNSRLYKSTNFGTNWTQLSFPVTSTSNNVGLVFVEFIGSSGTPASPTPVIFVGVSRTNLNANLYRSADGGATWTNVVTGAPGTQMPHHAAQDGSGNMYVTFNDAPGPNGIASGSVRKFNLTTLASSTVTPPVGQGGFAGVSVDRQNPGVVVVSTMNRWAPAPPGDLVYRSVNGGASWTATMAAQPSTVSAPWSVARQSHWAGDVEIDPFDSNRCWFVTGYGIIGCTNLASGGLANWSFTSDGIEEFYSFSCVSPPSGPSLLSVHGDQGGFRHYNLDASPPVTDYFPSHRVNNYAIDFAEGNPNVLVRLYSEGTFGGYSLNGGTTWPDFPSSVPGASSSSVGTIAVSADGKRFVWAPPGSAPYYSANNGSTWTVAGGSSGSGSRTVIADRVNTNKFYAYAGGAMYVSTDGGVNFSAGGSISSGVRPCAVFGREGHVWLPRGNSGLARSTNSAASFSTVSSVQRATFVGFGMAAAGQTYPAIFIAGRVSGVDGIYRSDDEGISWTRLNDSAHQFGFANYHGLCGDPRVWGRVYVATEGRGVVYGEPPIQPPAAPATLAAQGANAQIALTWSAVSGADGYAVKRSVVSGGPYAVLTNGLTQTVYTNTGLINGSAYFYVVSAFNAAGSSGDSPEAFARPVSAVPASIDVSVASSHLLLSWPADHTGWLLEAQTNAPGAGFGTNWGTLPASANTNQFVLPIDPANGSVFLRLRHP